MVWPRPHRVRQAALEQPIDLSHLAARRDFAIDRAQRGQNILAQVPERFEIAGEANALRNTLNGMTTVDLQQRQHGSPDLAHLAVGRTAQAQAGERQKAEETAE